MSQAGDTFHAIQYDPTAPKKVSKYRKQLSLPTIPARSADADSYRLSQSPFFSSSLYGKSLLLGSPAVAGGTPTLPGATISPLQAQMSLPPTPTSASLPPVPFMNSPLQNTSPLLWGSPGTFPYIPHRIPLPPSEPSSPNCSPFPRVQELRESAAYTPHPSSPKSYTSKRTRFEHILLAMQEHFDGIGGFMEMLCEDFPRGPSEKRSQLHRDMLSAWLNGSCSFRPTHFVQSIYRNRYSVPKYGATAERKAEIAMSFDGNQDPDTIRYARPALSVWALQLVARRCATEVGKLGKEDPAHPGLVPHLQASANDRMTGKHKTLSHDSVLGTNMRENMMVIEARAPATWFICTWMSAPRKKGIAIVRERRPYPFITAVAISMFAIARNRSANNYFALPIGIWLFASKAHSNVKRILCRLGLSVADTTVRKALITAGGKRKAQQQAETAEALARKEPACRKVLDNVQQYQTVHEHGLGKAAKLVTGTAATAIRLEDCAPGAFALDPYVERLIKNQRAELTVDMLDADLDFSHLHRVFAHHLVRILCEHTPAMKPHLPALAAIFRSAPIAIHRMREGRKTHVVALSCNGHAEMEVHGMKEAQKNFDRQVGYTPEAVSEADIILWDGGDGLFHVQLQFVTFMAENHYGLKITKDPSALSRAASATDLHTLTNTSSCDFYPTTRMMRTIFEARVLDLWDLLLANHTGRLLEDLAVTAPIPSLDSLLDEATVIVKRFISTKAFETALDADLVQTCPAAFKFPLGPVWTPDASAAAASAVEPDTKLHSELPNFTGDRVLANSILFLRDFMLFEEFSEALSDGDIGRVHEVLKVLIFMFAGASKQNYTTILLDLYCLFRYEASKELKDAIWNNWLVNLTGLLRRWLPDDLMQEHYNKWLEDMVSKHGGTFDDPFLRDTVSPNVNFFLRLKEEMEKAFELKKHGKSHTSPSVKDETRMLMQIYREDQLHYFCQNRSMGYAARELINAGYDTLDKGKLAEFKVNSTERAKLLALQRNDPSPAHPSDDDSTSGDGEAESSNEEDPEDAGNEEDQEEVHRRTGCEDAEWVFHIDPEADDGMLEMDEGDEEEGYDEVDLDRDVDTAGWDGENIDE
ncbi:hypothetical protein GGX14DRAFT_390366 [Mycena pura]|uniref:DUF6589 domain-containing protein n=1 Tax=Mycena pura TaxID=153505 RepID=A0AAD6VP54_9AGAR|nr:hypothetical protein GGX14DRAFT_390366 [Mycena pura]